MNWHADDPLLSAYASGDVDYAVGASVEQHLLLCGECRRRLAERPPVVALPLVWDRIREAVEDPRPTAVERIAGRLGLRASEARLLAAAPSLTAAWIGSLAVSLVFAVAAAYYGDIRGAVLFLLVAPLAPVAGVAIAYGPEGDPSHEAVASTPYPALRLVLLRSAAVLTTSVPLAGVAALLLPAPWWATAGWLLPALAFTAVVLALSSWIPTTVAAVVVGGGWVAAVLAAAARAGEPYAVVAPRLQVLYLVAGLVAGVVLVVRARRSDISGRLS
jgi:hypothetical protein